MLLASAFLAMTLSAMKEDPLKVTACWSLVDGNAVIEFAIKNVSTGDFSMESDRFPWYGGAILAAHQGDAMTGRGLARLYPTTQPDSEIVTIRKKSGEIKGRLWVQDYFKGLEGVRGLRVFWMYEVDGGIVGSMKYDGLVDFDLNAQKCADAAPISTR